MRAVAVRLLFHHKLEDLQPTKWADMKRAGRASRPAL